MRKLTIFAAASVLAAAAATGAAAASGNEASGNGADVDRALLAEVRQSTARFHDVRHAVAAGYLATEHCVEEPHLGGMGFHYINPTLVFDGGILDATQPEILLYAPGRNGRLRLAGVEYLVPAEDWTGNEPPDLFGVPFDGPMEEHEPGTTGDHYDQHAWVWMHNPDGVLATWNTALHCNP